MVGLSVPHEPVFCGYVLLDCPHQSPGSVASARPCFNRTLTTRHFYTTEEVLGEFLDFAVVGHPRHVAVLSCLREESSPIRILPSFPKRMPRFSTAWRCTNPAPTKNTV